MDEDGESGYLISDSGNAISGYQGMASIPHFPSPTIQSQGSWNIIGPAAHHQTVSQAPSPGSQLDPSEPSPASYNEHPSFDNAAATDSRIDHDDYTAAFGLTGASLSAGQHIVQGQFAFPDFQHGHIFDIAQYTLGGQEVTG